MKVGDYVRTKHLGGSIERIIEIIPIEKTPDLIELYTTDISTLYNSRITKDEIIKSSPNIIDLIEVGDYVDRLRVVEKQEDYIVVETFDERIFIYKNEPIKSIVTKERFESMEYKVESEVK